LCVLTDAEPFCGIAQRITVCSNPKSAQDLFSDLELRPHEESDSKKTSAVMAACYAVRIGLGVPQILDLNWLD